MSRVLDWACRSCGALLGCIRDGALEPDDRRTYAERVDADGYATFRCRFCKAVQTWRPRRAMMLA